MCIAHPPAPPLIFCMILFVCECALFGVVRIMFGRLSPSLLPVNCLTKLHLNATRRSLTATSSPRYLSRSYGTNDSDDRRGDDSKDSPMTKLERSFQLLGVNKHDCTVEQIRKAYIDLVKRYHPDSRTPHASAGKSAKVCLQQLIDNIIIP